MKTSTHVPKRGEKLLTRKLPLFLFMSAFIFFSLSCMTAKAGDPHITGSRVAVLKSSEIAINSPAWQDYNELNTVPVAYSSMRDCVVSLKPLLSRQNSPFFAPTLDNFALSLSLRAASGLATVPFESLVERTLPLSDDIDNLPTDTSAAAAESELESSHEPLLPSISKLDGETQWQIYVQACHEDKVKFCLIMAMADHESGYNPLLVGDDGDAIGIVQVQPKWHQNRLDKYGFTVEDLFDPVKCCIVAVDYLEELADYPNTEFEATHVLLMRYNMGPSGAAEAMRNGHFSSYYSRGVMPLYEQYLIEFVPPTSASAT